jgi:hypothetical protein
VLETVSAEAGRPVGAIVDRLIAAVRAFTEGAMQGDDITAMVIRYTGTDLSVK